jgi:small subunit ribosomal protein S6
MRTYELVLVYDPRVADDEVSALTGEVKNLLTAPGGVTITKTEVWGRRRLAYEIKKVNEGKYVVVYFAAEDGRAPVGEVEKRLLQNDRVLRFLTTRTDLGLKRAGLPIPTEVQADVVVAAAGGGDGAAGSRPAPDRPAADEPTGEAADEEED